jgi:hypothetical protein
LALIRMTLAVPASFRMHEITSCDIFSRVRNRFQKCILIKCHVFIGNPKYPRHLKLLLGVLTCIRIVGAIV